MAGTPPVALLGGSRAACASFELSSLPRVLYSCLIPKRSNQQPHEHAHTTFMCQETSPFSAPTTGRTLPNISRKLQQVVQAHPTDCKLPWPMARFRNLCDNGSMYCTQIATPRAYSWSPDRLPLGIDPILVDPCANKKRNNYKLVIGERGAEKYGHGRGENSEPRRPVLRTTLRRELVIQSCSNA